MVKATIIGANGYIGRNLIHYLINDVEEDIHIYGYDIQNESIIPEIKYQKIDIKNKDQVRMIKTNVDVLFLFSGLTGPSVSMEKHDDFIDVNEKGLLNLLDHMVMSGSKARIVYPSTRLIYRGQKDIPLKENSEKKCNSIYAVNKLACENILEVYRKLNDIRYTIIRICVPYGELVKGSQSYGTIGAFIRSATERGIITIYGNGDQKRSFIHIYDLCSAIWFLSNCDGQSMNEIYNVGGPDVFSIRELAEIVSKKYECQIENIPFPEMDEKLETGDTIFDDGKITKLGFIYEKNFSDYIK